MKILRTKPDYFAVGYYGQGFPSFLRVGLPVTRLGAGDLGTITVPLCFKDLLALGILKLRNGVLLSKDCYCPVEP